MLAGRLVNLRRAEKKDVALYYEWSNDREYSGEYQELWRFSLEKLEEIMLKGTTFFMIEKKDGTRIGHISSWTLGRTRELGFALVPSERRKGYGTEAIQMIVEYLVLNTKVVRMQVRTDEGNIPSHKALEKAGFTREGIMRKESYVEGDYRDMFLYSILREEWKEKEK